METCKLILLLILILNTFLSGMFFREYLEDFHDKLVLLFILTIIGIIFGVLILFGFFIFRLFLGLSNYLEIKFLYNIFFTNKYKKLNNDEYLEYRKHFENYITNIKHIDTFIPLKTIKLRILNLAFKRFLKYNEQFTI